MYWVNVTWLSVSFLSFVFNAIVLFLAIDRQHFRLERNILAVDPRYQYVIDNFAPYIIDLKTATIPMNILLLEGLWAALLFTIIVFFAAYKFVFLVSTNSVNSFRVFYSLYKNRRFLSQRITNAQKNIVITLFIYGSTFFGLIGFPTVAASTALVAGVSLQYFPLGPAYFISISVPAILFCIINILTVSPYRRAIRRLFSRIIHHDSQQSSTATIAGNRVAAIPFPQSLFTRERPIENDLQNEI
uniref:G protein-coupled receptor n=1 Tax=Caenorhabditis tropicalis TaxID=1561998 RepID=A0A1I7T3Y9_9PELO